MWQRVGGYQHFGGICCLHVQIQKQLSRHVYPVFGSSVMRIVILIVTDNGPAKINLKYTMLHIFRLYS